LQYQHPEIEIVRVTLNQERAVAMETSAQENL
jgi:hypothetical protein